MASSSESEDERVIAISGAEQSLGVEKDLYKTGQSSGSRRSLGSAGQSLGEASSCGQGQSYPRDDRLIQELRKMESSLKSSIEAVSNRVRRLEADRAGPPAKKRATTESSSHWADRDDMVDGLATPRWSRL